MRDELMDLALFILVLGIVISLGYGLVVRTDKAVSRDTELVMQDKNTSKLKGYSSSSKDYMGKSEAVLLSQIQNIYSGEEGNLYICGEIVKITPNYTSQLNNLAILFVTYVNKLESKDISELHNNYGYDYIKSSIKTYVINNNITENNITDVQKEALALSIRNLSLYDSVSIDLDIVNTIRGTSNMSYNSVVSVVRANIASYKKSFRVEKIKDIDVYKSTGELVYTVKCGYVLKVVISK